MNGVSESAGTMVLVAYGVFALLAIVVAFGVAWRVSSRASTDAKAVLSSVSNAAIASVGLAMLSICAVSLAAGGMPR